MNTLPPDWQTPSNVTVVLNEKNYLKLQVALQVDNKETRIMIKITDHIGTSLIQIGITGES